MFWTSDINQLLKPTLIPKDYMSDEEKLNTIVRLIIFISILFALVSLNKKFLIIIKIVNNSILPMIINKIKQFFVKKLRL